MSLNKVTLIGRLGNNPDVKFLPSGQQVANFSLATNERWTGKDGAKNEKVEWHRIVAWGKTAELCGKFLAKGREVYVEGKLQTEEWTDKEGVKKYTTKIHVSQVVFIGSAGTQKEPGEAQAPQQQGPSDPEAQAGSGAFF